MRSRHFLALCVLLSPAPALACRCWVADTEGKRAGYTASIAASAHVVATGRFMGQVRNGARLFVVRERLAGSSLRRFWVLDDRLTAGPNEIVFSCGVDTRQAKELVLVLKRRREEADGARAYEGDACATSFLTQDPEARALIGARRRHH
jgi:hypothetical protein